jgi:molecular chaperone GrpE
MTDEPEHPADSVARETEQSGEPSADAHSGDVTLTYGQYEELKTLAQERDEYLRRLQRAVADYQNLQKRMAKVRASLQAEAVRSAVDSMLPVADGLERALDAARQAEGAEDIVEGLELVARDFYGALARFDVRPIEAVGQQFDPHYHEAAMREDAEGLAPYTVVREMKKGFIMGDVVIRPTQVTVTGPPGEEANEAPEHPQS